MSEELRSKLKDEWRGAEDLQQILTYLVETAIIQRPRLIPQFFADQLECMLCQRTFTEQVKNTKGNPTLVDLICFPVNPYGWSNPALAGKIINCPNYPTFVPPLSTSTPNGPSINTDWPTNQPTVHRAAAASPGQPANCATLIRQPPNYNNFAPTGPSSYCTNTTSLGQPFNPAQAAQQNIIRMAPADNTNAPGRRKANNGYEVEFVISVGQGAKGAQGSPYCMENRQHQLPHAMGQPMYGQASQPTWQNTSNIMPQNQVSANIQLSQPAWQNTGNRMPQNQVPATGQQTQAVYRQNPQQSYQQSNQFGPIQPQRKVRDQSSLYTECIPDRPPPTIEEEEQRVTKDVGETLLYQNFIQPILKFLPVSEIFKEKKRLPTDIFERAVREMLANLKELRSVTLSTAQRIVDCFVRHYHDQLYDRRLEYGLLDDDIKYQVEIFQMIVASCIAGAGISLLGEKFKLDDPVLLANLATAPEAERLLQMRHRYPPRPDQPVNEVGHINSPYGLCIPSEGEPPYYGEVPKDIGEQLLFQNYIQPILQFLPMSNIFNERKNLQTDIFEKAIKGMLESLKELRSITQAKAQRILDCFVHLYRNELTASKQEYLLSDFDIQVQVEIFQMIVAACIAGAGITMLGDRYNLDDPEFLTVINGSAPIGAQDQTTYQNACASLDKNHLQDQGTQGIRFNNYQNMSEPPSSPTADIVVYLPKFESDSSISGMFKYPQNLNNQSYGHAVQGTGVQTYTPGKYANQNSFRKSSDGEKTTQMEHGQGYNNSVKYAEQASVNKQEKDSHNSVRPVGHSADQKVKDSKNSIKSVGHNESQQVKDSKNSIKSIGHSADQKVKDSKNSIKSLLVGPNENQQVKESNNSIKSVGTNEGQQVKDSNNSIKSVGPKAEKQVKNSNTSIKSVGAATADQQTNQRVKDSKNSIKSVGPNESQQVKYSNNSSQQVKDSITFVAPNNSYQDVHLSKSSLKSVGAVTAEQNDVKTLVKDSKEKIQNSIESVRSKAEITISKNSMKSFRPPENQQVKDSNNSIKSLGPKPDKPVKDSNNSVKSVGTKPVQQEQDANNSVKSAGTKADQQVQDSENSTKSILTKTGRDLQDSVISATAEVVMEIRELYDNSTSKQADAENIVVTSTKDTEAKPNNASTSSRVPDDFDPTESLFELVKIQKQKLEDKDIKLQLEIESLKKELEEKQDDADKLKKLQDLEAESMLLNLTEKQLTQVQKAAKHYKEDEKSRPNENVLKEYKEVYRYLKKSNAKDKLQREGLLKMNRKLNKFYDALADKHQEQDYYDDMEELVDIVDMIPDVNTVGNSKYPDNASDISIDPDKGLTKSNLEVEKKPRRRHHKKRKASKSTTDDRSRNSIVEANGFEWTPDASLRQVADTIYQSLKSRESSEKDLEK